jgi:CRISPR-associated protein Csh1
MGFLHAVYALGEMAGEAVKDSPLADIMNFLQLPYPVTEDKNDKVFAIRVWLEAADSQAEVLDIRGVVDVDRIEYKAISSDRIKIKERCLYRDPVGSNVSWRFSPLYKLGRATKNPHKELVGESGVWQDNKKSRFYKLHNNLLYDYEKTGAFTKGSAERIMADLLAMIERIIEFWDRKTPCFILFGLKSGDNFLYPGEVAAFVNYFKDKLDPDVPAKQKKEQLKAYCALCGEKDKKLETLDKVFKFATFDKQNFLPGTKDRAGVKEKIFPVCETCYGVLSAGKEEMENKFVNFNAIPNTSLYVIPEIISDRKQYYRMASDNTKDFLKNGIRNEQNIFNLLARVNEGLVFHFLFAEVNQAQLIVHSLIEDVPPTRLRKLEELWQESCIAFGYEIDSNGKKGYLHTAISQIVAVLLSLAGKREQEKLVMKDKMIAIISALLNSEQVGIAEIKSLIVARLAGMFTDPDWLSPKEKEQMPGRKKIKGMAEVLDFLYRVNGRE